MHAYIKAIRKKTILVYFSKDFATNFDCVALNNALIVPQYKTTFAASVKVLGGKGETV